MARSPSDSAERPARPFDGLRTWRASLGVYADRRIVAILFLGFSSGLPLALTLGTLSILLARVGVDKTTIGLFAAVTLPYSLKFIWAPAIDRAPFPWLTRYLGQRRGWTVASQLALMAGICAMAGTDPAASPGIMAVFALIVSFCSASQDVVIDAYRVELLEENKIGAGASAIVFGYRVGMLASGAGALYLADQVDWGLVYVVMAALVVVGLATILVSREPDKRVSDETLRREQHIREYLTRRPELTGWRADMLSWLYGAVLGPFVEFMKRPLWLGILLFVVFFKFGDSLAGVMTGPFLVDLGFTNTEIAYVGKIYGFGATMIGFVLGGWMISRLGMITSLWICGILQMLSNLMFAVQASVGYDTTVLAAVIGVENLAGGMGTAALVAYLSSLCNIAYTATQYALLSSLAAAARTFLSTPAGKMVELLDWLPFFLVTAAAALPGLAFLLWLSLSGRRLEAARAMESRPGARR